MIPLPVLSIRACLRIAGGVALIAVAIWAWRINALRGEHLASLARCETEKTEQAEAFSRAQRAATDKAEAAKARKEAEHEALRQKSDADLADLRERYRAVVLRQTAGRSASGSAHLPRTATTAQSADGPRDSAVVSLGTFVISEADALTCADNTARLQAAQTWAISIGKDQ